ncbi:MAG TPA: hypothetical protein VJ826_01600 [Candidatus Polarisedimenticolaceae bacterium]|nr:hypothetical protein [Candidatus Polarisedimenticolaceae bacterium]
MRWASVALAAIAVASILTMIAAPRFSPLALAAWGGVGFVLGCLTPPRGWRQGLYLLSIVALSAWNVFGPPPQPAAAKWEVAAMWAGVGLGWALERFRSSGDEPAATKIRA